MELFFKGSVVIGMTLKMSTRQRSALRLTAPQEAGATVLQPGCPHEFIKVYNWLHILWGKEELELWKLLSLSSHSSHWQKGNIFFHSLLGMALLGIYLKI